ncbi:MAG: branched-chain amino acid transaminase [Acidobacteriota bacterium]|nr:branched-chain amino acid transaminase [Acidobacteriota bacterium]
MAFDEKSWVWMNGELIRWNEANIHVSAHALHYGSGVFEGIRCYATERGPAVFRLDEHLERLFASAAVYGLEIPYTQTELKEAVSQLIRQNGFESCYIRPICFYGSDSLGVHPARCPVEVVIMAWKWATYLGAEGLERGVRVTISPWVKFHSSMMPTTAKACGQYLNSILAVREAVSRGYDEALLLDADGNLSEGSGENLFLVKDGKLLTNDQRHSILLGITRNACLEIAQELGYEVESQTLRVEDLMNADEIFFTGTAAEVTPVREIDGTAIGTGARGPITERIQSAFMATVSGLYPKFENWLHFIPS